MFETRTIVYSKIRGKFLFHIVYENGPRHSERYEPAGTKNTFFPRLSLERREK